MVETVEALMPEPVPIKLDQDRTLQYCVAGWRHLEKRYENTAAVLSALSELEIGKGKVFTDLPQFVYAGLLDADEKSPLSLREIETLIEQGADMEPWRTAVSQAVLNFFRPRTTGKRRATRGPGRGLIGWFAARAAALRGIFRV